VIGEILIIKIYLFAQQWRREKKIMPKLTKSQLLAAMAGETGLSKKEVADFLEKLACLALKEVKKNGVFVVPGLGKLVKINRAARMGRNPATGETIQIKAKTVVKFRVAKAVKEAVL
jgi:DNA-binding protein HU-beta